MSETREFFNKVGSQVDTGECQPVPPAAPSTISPGFGKQLNDNRIPDAPQQWSSNGQIFWGSQETFENVPGGFYRTGISESVGAFITKQPIAVDHLLTLPDEASSQIIAEFEQFWTIGERFAERGFVWKRGYLLYGPPGSGKTSTIQQMAKKLVDRGDIVLILDNPTVAGHCLRMIRMIEPMRPIICIMEDFDALVKMYGTNEFLSLLDGEAQVERICFVATTNYPEFLDRRFVDRPSRFDTIRYVGMPSALARYVYLEAKEPSLSKDELSRWVDKTDGYSLAHLKEVIVAVRCFGQKFEDVIERLNDMREGSPSSEDNPQRRRPSFLPLRNGKDAAHAAGQIGKH